MWCWYLLAGGGGAADGSVFPDLCKVGLDTAFWKTPEALTLLNPGGCLDVSVCNFYQSLMVIVFYLSFSVYVFFPPFLYFLFLFTYMYSRLFFPLFFLSLILDLVSSISRHSPLVHLPPSLSLGPGGFQFWAIVLLPCSPNMEDEFCHSDKERKSWKSLPKLQGQHFPFLGGFNFKKKKMAASSPSPAGCSLLFGLGVSVEGQPDETPLLGSMVSGLSCSRPASVYCIFLKSRQKW